jgi:hypothetical protein
VAVSNGYEVWNAGDDAEAFQDGRFDWPTIAAIRDSE